MIQHNDCDTKKEIGCFYYSCYSCGCYTTKENGKIIHWKWDKKKQKHINTKNRQ